MCKDELTYHLKSGSDQEGPSNTGQPPSMWRIAFRGSRPSKKKGTVSRDCPCHLTTIKREPLLKFNFAERMRFPERKFNLELLYSAKPEIKSSKYLKNWPFKNLTYSFNPLGVHARLEHGLGQSVDIRINRFWFVVTGTGECSFKYSVMSMEHTALRRQYLGVFSNCSIPIALLSPEKLV